MFGTQLNPREVLEILERREEIHSYLLLQTFESRCRNVARNVELFWNLVDGIETYEKAAKRLKLAPGTVREIFKRQVLRIRKGNRIYKWWSGYGCPDPGRHM